MPRALDRADIVIGRDGRVSSAGGEEPRRWDSTRGKEGSYRVSLGVVEVVPLGASHCLAYASTTLTVATEQGVAQVPGAFTLVLEKSSAGWKILHEHSSVKAE